MDGCCMNGSMLLQRLCRLPYRQLFIASLLLTVTGIQLYSGEHFILFFGSDIEQ